MAEASIPVDLLNPGQVFASLGFLEAADILCGDAEGGFDWSDEADVRFRLRAVGGENPFAVALDFVAEAEITELEAKNLGDGETFPCRRDEPKARPIRLKGASAEVGLSHWADGSSRNAFKLYAGNRSAAKIAIDMAGLRDERDRGEGAVAKGGSRNRGIADLWRKQREDLVKQPFDVITAMGGSFNFDPRGGWVAIDAGYSPNEHKDHRVKASPTLELLAAWGLEHARPNEYETRRVEYGVWGKMLPPMLARAVLGGANVGVPARMFRFDLALSGKNKVVTFAQEVTS